MKDVSIPQPLFDRVVEHVEFVQQALAGTDIDMGTWLADPDRFDLLDGESPETLQRESLTYSWGFIVGCAEALGCTPDDLFHKVDLFSTRHEPDCQPRSEP